jgi:hypothetical protein
MVISRSNRAEEWFRTVELEALAAEWRRAVFAAVGPALRPH